MTKNEKRTVGKAEYAWLVEGGVKKVPARIDTGARTSAVWATGMRETPDGLEYILFGEACPLYSGQKIIAKHFTKIAVASSNGHIQVRYRIPVTIQIKGRRIKSFYTLTDRSTQAYPLLIGRNTLNGKFVVDVQRGSYTLNNMDQKRFDELQDEMHLERGNGL